MGGRNGTSTYARYLRTVLLPHPSVTSKGTYIIRTCSGMLLCTCVFAPGHLSIATLTSPVLLSPVRTSVVHALAGRADEVAEVGGQRKKRNKYAQFSKADQVAKSLRFSNLGDGSNSERETSARMNPSYSKRERNVWRYPDAADIDQRDPSSFGFTEVGVVLGAHGTRGEVRVKSDSDFAVERLCTPGKIWLRRPRRRAPREQGLVGGRKGPGKGIWLVMLEEVTTREDAAALRGASLHIRRELRPSMGGDELLLWELEGLKVVRAVVADGDGGERNSDVGAWTHAGEVLGIVTGVIPREEITGDPCLGHDLLEVEKAASRDQDLGEGDLTDGKALTGEDSAQAQGEGDEDEHGDQDEEGEADLVLVPYVEQIVVEVRLEEGVILVDPPEGLFDLIQPRKKERVTIRALLPQYAESLAAKE